VLCAAGAVAAGGQVCCCPGQRPAEEEWLDDRAAGSGQRAGDRAPQRTQRLLNRAVWDTFAAVSVVRRFAVAGLDEAARRRGRRGGLAVRTLDETSQVKQGAATAGVKRHYLGCVGKVANGITTVHLSYVRERTGHALIGARRGDSRAPPQPCHHEHWSAWRRHRALSRWYHQRARLAHDIAIALARERLAMIKPHKSEEVSRTLADHHGCCIGAPAHNRRHDGGIHHSQLLQSADATELINHCAMIRIWAHSATAR
jgi:DDE superfamily endonuclease